MDPNETGGGIDLMVTLFALSVSSAIALAAAIVATLASSSRVVGFCLLICGMGVGGIYLSLGAEFLAIMQWLISVLIGISFSFYAILFGSDSGGRGWVQLFMPIILAGVFVSALWIGTQGLPALSYVEIKNQGLVALGEVLVSHHLVSLEVISLTLFLGIVGIGVISRPENSREIKK